MGLYDCPRRPLHAEFAQPPLESSTRRLRDRQRVAVSRTRHFYGWYALNILDLPPHVIALHLGHTDGGRLIRELYGHPDAAIARERIREAFRQVASVTAVVTPLVTAA